MNPASYFGSLQYVPGIGYVQPQRGDTPIQARPYGDRAVAGLAGGRGLGDDGAVMMISGLGKGTEGSWPNQAMWAAERARYEAWGVAANIPGMSVQAWAGPIPPATWPGPGAGAPAAPGLIPPATVDLLKQPITLFNTTLPLWAWLAIAALLGGAGGATLMHFKMKR